jgi:signal transduction histidine kinase
MTAPNRLTLLVVDDEPEVLRSLHDLFRRDYQVVTFQRAADALAALDGLDPPVVMSDQRMPGLSGVEFLREVRRRRPDATRLLFTGYADLSAVIDAINEGHVFRYITKPWDPQELAATVRQAFERHALLTERQRLIAELQASNARLAEADRLKGAFIEVASHELNTPVAVILGIAELWAMSQAEDATPSQRGWVERIQGAGRRLAGTVERMLSLLRADRLGETLAARPTELAPLIGDMIHEIGPFLDARRQRVELDLDPALGSAEIDPEKVGDLLTNLMVNAIKFTPDGGTIRLAAGPLDGDRVRIRVSDRGMGIAPRDQTHLFEPFFTGYDTMHHCSGDYQFGRRGLGLGLCLVKRFAEMHGGTVEVASAPGQGSTFTVVLPRRHADLRPERDGNDAVGTGSGAGPSSGVTAERAGP